MPSTVIYTGTTGPGQSLAAATFTDVVELTFNFTKKTISVISGSPVITAQLALTGVTSVSDSISGGNHTVTIS